MGRYRYLILVCLLISCESTDTEPRKFSGLEMDNVLLFSQHKNAHNAFPGISKINDTYYLTYRSSDKHVHGQNGKIEVYESNDLTNWNLVKIISNDSLDLRDPNFVEGPDGLRVYYHGSQFVDQKLNATYDFYWKVNAEIEQVFVGDEIDDNIGWPWRIEYIGSKYYSFVYSTRNNVFELFGSDEGKFFEQVTNAVDDLYLGTKLESSFIEHKGNWYATVRTLDANDRLIYSQNAGESWEVLNELPFSNMGGPDLIVLDNNLIFGGRVDIEEVPLVRLYKYDLETNEVSVLLDLPGDYDNGYPDIIVNDDKMIIAYYATDDPMTAIKVATLSIVYQ